MSNLRRKHPEALSSKEKLAKRDIRDLIFGFEGMTNAFRDVNAVSAASRHTPFGRDCVAYTSIRINAPVCKHPSHKSL